MCLDLTIYINMNVYLLFAIILFSPLIAMMLRYVHLRDVNSIMNSRTANLVWIIDLEVIEILLVNYKFKASFKERGYLIAFVHDLPFVAMQVLMSTIPFSSTRLLHYHCFVSMQLVWCDANLKNTLQINHMQTHNFWRIC